MVVTGATIADTTFPPEPLREVAAEAIVNFRCLSTVAPPLELSDVPATIRRMGTGESGSSGYWIDGPQGCPIGGPFDLWRPNYFHANGEPPEDMAVEARSRQQRSRTRYYQETGGDVEVCIL